ncbi:MAG: CotH kinase family protein [Myxococcota bacterium]
MRGAYRSGAVWALTVACLACGGAGSDSPAADGEIDTPVAEVGAPDGGAADDGPDAPDLEVDAEPEDVAEPAPEIEPQPEIEPDDLPADPGPEVEAETGDADATDGPSDAASTADEIDATTEEGCPDPTADETLRQALILSGQNVVEISIGLSQSNIAYLRTHPYSYVAGTIALADASGLLGPFEVAIRLKGGGKGNDGGSFQDIDNKPSFKVDMNRLVPCQTLAGMSKMTLNNMVQDPSMLHEWVAYGLYRNRDLPAPRVGYAWVTVNGQEYGLYANIEVYDQRAFRHEHFPSTAHLYEGQSGSDFSVSLAGGFEVDHGDPLDRSDLDAAIAALVAAPPEGLVATTNAHFHWPAVATFLAVENFVGQQDGYTQQRNNFYAHSDDDGRFTLLPWGHDTTLGTPLLFGYLKGNIAKRCLRDPDCHLLYEEAMAATVIEVSTGNLIQRVQDRAATLEPWVVADPRRPYTLAEHYAERDTLLLFLSEQPVRLMSSVACAADTTTDSDKDGYDCIHDCDDSLSSVYPGSVALCP